MKYIGNVKLMEALENEIKEKEGFFTTDSAGAVYSKHGECEYYSVLMQRGTIFNDGKEVVEAYKQGKITLLKTKVEKHQSSPSDEMVIITRHKATEEILVKMFPNSKIVGGFATAEDVKDKVVIGVLPPELAIEAKAVANFVIPNFNYQTDGDMSKEEIQERGGFLTEFVSLKKC